MKSERNILVAFILNLSFSIFEIIGGLLTNSIAIVSDAIHDFGDAISIGIAFILEKKSKKKPDDNYTYGYARYSVLGAFITTLILTVGSIFVIYNSIKRLINPVPINYNGMIIFAIFGIIINFLATYFTKDGHSLNQKSVNLHMLEDVLGWVVVFIGSIIMKFTDISLIDALMSMGVSSFILINALKNFKEIIDLVLEKTPTNISIEDLKHHICEITGVIGVHHLHLWSIDGSTNYATMHIVTNEQDIHEVKKKIKEMLRENQIAHTTIEIERENEKCDEEECNIQTINIEEHHHHHHNH